MSQDLLRALPAVDRLAGAIGGAHASAAAAARHVLERRRAAILAGESPNGELVEEGQAWQRLIEGRRLGRVLNATGVVVHTNLGRSSWSPAAIEAAGKAMGYTALEMDLASGQRGGRLAGLQAQMQLLTGAEDALVVNNCAAAVLLALTAIARDREVIVSRGELVEIGGSFRVPDVIASGGARLVEVGTTNRTRAADYARAITPDTAMLLRIHPSNFRVVGFTETPDREAMVALGASHGLPVLEDLGAGSLAGDWGEPSVRDVVGSGVDLVMFSGDKLLGGPQCGLIVGRSEWVTRLRKHPLYRALRVGKVTLAALEATLGDHLLGRPVPTLSRLHAAPEGLEARATAWCEALGGELVAADGAVGGGALPGQALPGWACALLVSDPNALAQRLRTGDPAVVPRIRDGRLLLDPRCVHPDDDDALLSRVAAAIGPR